MQNRRRLSAIITAVAALSTAAMLFAGAAAAHVTVAAPGVAPGASDAAITFRVPDESATASTVGVKLQLPTDQPIAGVLVAPIPGWTATITNKTLSTPLKTDDGNITEVVSEIDWKADATAGIKPGYFGQFTIIAGKLPDGVSSLTFKAIQNYSDGTTVSWIDVAAPGSTATVEHPAPVLNLNDAGSSASSTAPTAGAGSGSPAVTAAPAAASAAGAAGASKGSATAGIVLGGIGVVLGAAALALTLTRGRRSTAE
jgi:uncharacterized protein